MKKLSQRKFIEETAQLSFPFGMWTLRTVLIHGIILYSVLNTEAQVGEYMYSPGTLPSMRKAYIGV